MTEGNSTGVTHVAPVCPLCAGTGRRRIHQPGTPRRASVLIPCHCAATPKGTK